MLIYELDTKKFIARKRSDLTGSKVATGTSRLPNYNQGLPQPLQIIVTSLPQYGQ